MPREEEEKTYPAAWRPSLPERVARNGLLVDDDDDDGYAFWVR